MRATLFITLLTLLTALGPAGRAADQPGPGGGREPIAISADRLETDETTGVVNFSGAVVARQGGLTITCDLMKVFYRAAPSAAPAGRAAGGREEGGGPPLAQGRREIERVEGFGHVRLVDGDRLAVGEHALYLAKSDPRRLILTGDARVWQGRDSVAGHRITYFLDEKRSLVESVNRQRVRTVIQDGAGRTQAP